MSVVGPILRFGTTRGEAHALVTGERAVTYGEFAGLVLRTAAHLAAHGMKRADRIGLCLRDGPDHLLALLAVAQLGATAVPLDWRAPPAENARLIAGLGLACVLVEKGARGVEGCPSLAVDADWQRAVARADPATGSPATWHDPFVISATSGSTGSPKFTIMTHWQFYFAVVAMWELMRLAGRHRYLNTLPLYYSGGRNSCLAHLLRGDCVVLYSSLFTPAEYVDVVNRQLVTVAAVVPSMVRQLLGAAGDAPLLPALSAFFCTGAPLHPEEKRQAVRGLSPQFHERYGTAETLAISVLRPIDLADRADSVGQPHSLAEIEIVDDADRPLPNGATGRLRFRAPGMASPLPGSAATANFRDGWFYPGETGRLDEAGYIFLRGRTAEIIIRSGAKVFPGEVEAVLVEHPGVLDAAVLGQAGADGEEAVVAFVVPRGEVAAGDLLAHCRIRLAPHKVPRRFHIVDGLPKNTAGKIDKTVLAARLPQKIG